MGILTNYEIIKELGYGMFGNVYLIKNYSNGKKYALKIQHVEKKDLKPNKKSSIWREISFSLNFANKHPSQFIKLCEYDFINGCEKKISIPFDINTFPLNLQKKIISLNKSPYCVRLVYDLVEGNLHQLEGKLTKQQIYSMIIQLTYSIELLHSNNYAHMDIHDRNVGWIKTLKTHKIKINNYYIPTHGYIFKLIDYGMVMNKSDISNNKEKKEFEIEYNNELVLLVHFMVDNTIYDYINSNKIKINFDSDYAQFKETKFYQLIKKYSKLKSIQMFLFDILFPTQYQKITFGSSYTHTIERKLFIPFEDIEYFILNYKTPNLIIKYFRNKLQKIDNL